MIEPETSDGMFGDMATLLSDNSVAAARAQGALLSHVTAKTIGDLAFEQGASAIVFRTLWQASKRIEALEQELASLRVLAKTVVDTSIANDGWVAALNDLHYHFYPTEELK